MNLSTSRNKDKAVDRDLSGSPGIRTNEDDGRLIELLEGGLLGAQQLGKFHEVAALKTRYAEAMEYFFTCPYCWAEISMVLEPSIRHQTYVEDCEVCCHPIEIEYAVEDDAVVAFEARVLE